MAATITVEEAQARLMEVIRKLTPGEEVVITDNQRPVAKLIGERLARLLRPEPGEGKGSVLYMAPDFDESMDEFEDYTQ